MHQPTSSRRARPGSRAKSTSAGRASYLATTVLAGLAGVFSAFVAKPWIVWNASPSLPTGLYVFTDSAWDRNDIVAVRPDATSRPLLERHSGLRSRRVLIKRVAARRGDLVCRHEARITINGRDAALARLASPGGDALPTWDGCVTLPSSKVLLLADHPLSFDGRYLGPTEAADIVGRLTPLWLTTQREQTP